MLVKGTQREQQIQSGERHTRTPQDYGENTFISTTKEGVVKKKLA